MSAEDAHGTRAPGTAEQSAAPTTPAMESLGADTGPNRLLWASVSADPLRMTDIEALVAADAHGAIVTFSGVVRDADDGRAVTALEYEAHPDAEQTMHDVAHALLARHPEVRLAVAHRLGRLGIGELALAAAVSSPHRAEAFAACAELVDEIKAGVPIWKLQRFVEGEPEWVAGLG